MKTAISFGRAPVTGEDWPEVAGFVREAERLGVRQAGRDARQSQWRTIEHRART